MFKKAKFPFYLSITVFLTLGLSISLQSLLAAWAPPTSNPPVSSIGEVLTGGSNAQVKLGQLGIGNDFSVGAATLDDFYVNTSTGNVGIGTSLPGAKLEIDMEDLTTTEGLHISRDLAASHYSYLNIENENGNPVFKVNENGNVGIGMNSPNAKLEIDMENLTTTEGLHISRNAAADHYSYLNIEDETLSPIFKIDKNGNIGIGAGSPSAKLEIDMKNSTTLEGLHISRDAAADHNSYLSIENETAGSVFKIDKNGNVGIGIDNPTAKLHVNGGISTDGSAPVNDGDVVTKKYFDENAGGGGGGGGGSSLMTVVNLSTVGSGNWTVPEGVNFLIVTLQGGGGGGGGGSTVIQCSGGGGASGEYHEDIYMLVNPGDIIPYTVGAGGAGGAVANSGQVGGDTIFGSFLAKGGNPGVGQSVSHPSRGGVARTYDNKDGQGYRTGGSGGDLSAYPDLRHNGDSSEFYDGGFVSLTTTTYPCGGGGGASGLGAGGAGGKAAYYVTALFQDLTTFPATPGGVGAGGGGGGGATAGYTSFSGAAGGRGHIKISYIEGGGGDLYDIACFTGAELNGPKAFCCRTNKIDGQVLCTTYSTSFVGFPGFAEVFSSRSVGRYSLGVVTYYNTEIYCLLNSINGTTDCKRRSCSSGDFSIVSCNWVEITDEAF